jgi:histone H3/H4
LEETKLAVDKIVKKAIAAKAHKMGFNVSGDAYQAIDDAVEAIITKATHRAKANKRKTLMAYDF